MFLFLFFFFLCAETPANSVSFCLDCLPRMQQKGHSSCTGELVKIVKATNHSGHALGYTTLSLDSSQACH